MTAALLIGEAAPTQVDGAIKRDGPPSVALLDDAPAQQALAMLVSRTSVRIVAQMFATSVWCIDDLRLGLTHKHLPR